MKSFVLVLFALLTQAYLRGQSFDVMTYNIRYDTPTDGPNRWDNRKEDVVALLNYYQPAIFGIQEGVFHQVQFLDSRLAQYTYIGQGRDDGQQKGEFSAIFFDTTRFSLVTQGTFWLSERSEQVSVGWDAAMERICTYGVFIDKPSGKKILCLNTHYDHLGEKAREMSSRLLVNKLETLNKDNYPILLMGDLNCTPESLPIQILTSRLEDALSISGKPLYGPAGTFNGFELDPDLDRRIDYVMVSGLIVKSYAHLDDRTLDHRFISDHLPVLVRLDLP